MKRNRSLEMLGAPLLVTAQRFWYSHPVPGQPPSTRICIRSRVARTVKIPKPA